MTLRPLTTLATAHITFAMSGNYAHYNYGMWSQFENAGLKAPDEWSSRDIDLNGATVSKIVKLYKGLMRLKKDAAKNWSPMHRADLNFTFGGEAADLDLVALAKLPTPEEDWTMIRKVRKMSALTNKAWGRAFALMGYDAAPIKEGRKIIGFTVDGVKHLPPEGGYGPWNGWVLEKSIREKWATRASELLDLPDPGALEGLPTRARDYRTDLNIRTCPCCFRDIKASSHTYNLMAPHGFTIEGRDWSGWGGERQGGCLGVDLQPWEKSPEGCRRMLQGLLFHALNLEKKIARFDNGEIKTLLIKKWCGVDRQVVEITPEDTEWREEFESARGAVVRQLGDCWSGRYASIPWYRMALREWKPVADDQIAVGAPHGRPTRRFFHDDDYAGEPAVLKE